MTRPARVLLAGFSGVAGHLTRLLAVADAIRGQEHTEIAVLGAGRFRSLAAARDVAVADRVDRPLDLFAIDNPEHATRIVRAWFRLAFADDLAVVEAWKPDCVVVDSRWPTVAVARRLGIPVVAIANTVWTRHRRALGLANEPVFTHLEDMFRAAVAPVLAGLGDPLPARLEAFHEGDHTHLADLAPLLGPSPPNEPGTTLGPIIWRPRTAPAVPWPAGDGPRVYLTAGSTGTVARMDQAAELLAHRGWSVVLSGVDRPSVQPGLRRVSFCDPGPLLDDATAVVSHGGIGTIYQSIEHAVPVVVSPANLDQVAHGELVARSGVGLCAEGDSPVAVADAVERVHDDSRFGRRAEELREAIASENGAASVASTVLEVVSAVRA